MNKQKTTSPVAWMQRSVIRGYRHRPSPDSTALHPGYIAVFVCVSLLSGCMEPSDKWVRHQTEVRSETTDTTLVLHTDKTLSTANLRALSEFRQNWINRPGQRLQLSAASGSEASAIEAANWLSTRGLAPALKRDPILPKGTLHLAVINYQTRIPQCGNWDKATDPNFSNAPASDFGCSNARNLGLMVADPADLAAPAGLSEGSGMEAAAIERYRSFHDEAASSSAVSINLGGGESTGSDQ